MSSSKGFFMRMLPFFATFAIGLFIASFFVNISAPSFPARGGKRQEIKRLRIEMEELKNENLRMRNQIENMERNSGQARHPGEEELRGLTRDSVKHPPEMILPTMPAKPAAPKPHKIVK